MWLVNCVHLAATARQWVRHLPLFATAYARPVPTRMPELPGAPVAPPAHTTRRRAKVHVRLARQETLALPLERHHHLSVTSRAQLARFHPRARAQIAPPVLTAPALDRGLAHIALPEITAPWLPLPPRPFATMCVRLALIRRRVCATTVQPAPTTPTQAAHLPVLASAALLDLTTGSPVSLRASLVPRVPTPLPVPLLAPSVHLALTTPTRAAHLQVHASTAQLDLTTGSPANPCAPTAP